MKISFLEKYLNDHDVDKWVEDVVGKEPQSSLADRLYGDHDAPGMSRLKKDRQDHHVRKGALQELLDGPPLSMKLYPEPHEKKSMESWSAKTRKAQDYFDDSVNRLKKLPDANAFRQEVIKAVKQKSATASGPSKNRYPNFDGGEAWEDFKGYNYTDQDNNRYPVYQGDPDLPLEDVYPEELLIGGPALKGVKGACKGAKALYKAGPEYKVGKNLKIAPLGNRTGNMYGERPHYHSTRYRKDAQGNPKINKKGEKIPKYGQGKGLHRPWEDIEPKILKSLKKDRARFLSDSGYTKEEVEKILEKEFDTKWAIQKRKW